MLRNKRFKLTKPTLALDAIVRRGWITIPAGEIIRVLAGPNGEDNQMIDILWQGRMLTMLAIDVTAGCQEIKDGSTRGRRSSSVVSNHQPTDPVRKRH
jgi:hypothetical protein